MTEKRYIYVSIGIGFEILDSWFGYTGDGEPTEREIEEYDYLVIGLASNQDAAEGICRRLNDQQDEINHLSNFGLHVILDKKNKEIEQLNNENKQLKELIADKNKTQTETLKQLTQTQKELITIKNTIKDMYDNERTHLGHNVLAQLMEAIQ